MYQLRVSLCLVLFGVTAVASESGHTLRHGANGQLKVAPPVVNTLDGLRICVDDKGVDSLALVANGITASSDGECYVLTTGMVGKGNVLHYELRTKAGAAPHPTLDTTALNRVISDVTNRTKTLFPNGFGVLAPSSAAIAPCASPNSADWSKCRDLDLAPAITGLEKLVGALEKAGATHPEFVALTAALLELRALAAGHGAWRDVHAPYNGDIKVVFSGEFPLGEYRRSVFMNESGETLSRSPASDDVVAPHDQLIFYMQRKGSTLRQVEMTSEGKGKFFLTSPLPPSQVRADWVLERIGDGTNFAARKDVIFAISEIQEGKPVKLREVSVPVVDSYRFSFTTGVYFSDVPRRTYYLSDLTVAGRTETDTTTTTIPPGTSERVIVEVPVAKRVVALAEPSGRQPAAAGFFSFYLRPRTDKPGKVFRKEYFAPAFVIGAKLDAPLKEGLLGIAVEPIRGLQLIGGLVKATRVELGEGLTVGQPLGPGSDKIQTIEKLGKTTSFFAIALDVKPIAVAADKLIAKLF